MTAWTDQQLRDVIAEAGGDWAAISQAASEIILFGSRAAGCADSTSDWDILCIGSGRPLHTARLDLIWKSADALKEPDWLDDELALHIRDYGVWLKGEPTWLASVHVSPRTVSRKRRIVEARADWAESRWARWRPGFRASQSARIRRDVQRLAHLRAQRAIPPRAALDDAWADSPDPSALLLDAGLDGLAVRKALTEAATSRKPSQWPRDGLAAR